MKALPALCTTMSAVFSMSWQFTVALGEEITADNYVKCPKGLVARASRSTRTSRSSVNCVQQCSQGLVCTGVNVCPAGTPGQVACTFTEATEQGECNNLTIASSPSCFHAQKIQKPAGITSETTSTTKDLVCQNGGTIDKAECYCHVQYGGKTCERYMRDCSESYDRGYQGISWNGPYYIQPVTSASPFVVLCNFRWGGVTLPFIRTDSSSFDRDWNTCKAGFGDDLWSKPKSVNFFVGLENMHHLLNQATYLVHVYIKEITGVPTGDGAFYNNFSIGPESESYAVHFDGFLDSTSGADDGFLSPPPVVFSTVDNDPKGCYAKHGKAGWYGSDCTGYGMFSNGSFFWPKNGTDAMLKRMEFLLSRKSPIYDD